MFFFSIPPCGRQEKLLEMRFTVQLAKRSLPLAQHVARHAAGSPAFQLSAALGARGQWLARSQARPAGEGRRSMSGGTVTFTIFDPVMAPEGATVTAKIGDNVLDVAQKHDLELEGACEGTLACSTCHCIFPKELFDKLPAMDEEELDMLDLAGGLTDT